MIHIGELVKVGNRTRAMELLKECKKREAEEKVIIVRKDERTIALVPSKKAKERGLIK